MKSKLGLIGDNKDDLKLINSLLNWMEKNKADYTNTFCYLMDIPIEDEIYNDKSFTEWVKAWNNRSTLNNSNKENQFQLMKKVNPIIIPRNYQVENALNTAKLGNLNPMKKLLYVIKKPYDNQDNIIDYQKPPVSTNEKYQTFCGT